MLMVACVVFKRLLDCSHLAQLMTCVRVNFAISCGESAAMLIEQLVKAAVNGSHRCRNGGGASNTHDSSTVSPLPVYARMKTLDIAPFKASWNDMYERRHWLCLYGWLLFPSILTLHRPTHSLQTLLSTARKTNGHPSTKDYEIAIKLYLPAPHAISAFLA